MSHLFLLNAREAKVIWFQGHSCCRWHVSSGVIIPTQGFSEAFSSVALWSGAGDAEDVTSHPEDSWFIPQTYVREQMKLWLQLQGHWAKAWSLKLILVKKKNGNGQNNLVGGLCVWVFSNVVHTTILYYQQNEAMVAKLGLCAAAENFKALDAEAEEKVRMAEQTFSFGAVMHPLPLRCRSDCIKGGKTITLLDLPTAKWRNLSKSIHRGQEIYCTPFKTSMNCSEQQGWQSTWGFWKH